MTNWEYRLVAVKTTGGMVRQFDYDEDIVDKCNAAGREGWDLVSVVPLNEANGRTQAVHLFFKRPR